MNYTTTTNGYVNSAGTSSNGVIYLSTPTQNGPQSIIVTIQPDTDWVNHNVVPFGLFVIELAIAFAIVIGARCAFTYFGGNKPLIPTKRK